MADDYDPFNLRKNQAGYTAELIQEGEGDVARTFAKNHAYDGGILSKLENNPYGDGDSPLPYDPSQPELRSTSEGGSAFTARPHDYMQPVAEAISPTLGAFGAGQMAGTAYKQAGEGDYQEAGMSLAPLLAGMVVPGAPKGVRGPKVLSREIDARGFYSPSLEAVKGLGQDTGTVQQFRSMLLKAGGKPKELDAVGFDRAFPDPNAKVSRAELEQYLRDNRVQLGEQRLGFDTGNPESALASKFESYSTPGGIPGSYREVVTTLPFDQKVPLKLGEPELFAGEGVGNWEGRYPVSGVKEIPFEIGDQTWGRIMHWPETYNWKGEPQGQKFIVNSPQILNAQFKTLDEAKAAISESYNLSGHARAGKAMGQDRKDIYTSSHWPGITNPLLHYRTKDFINHADPTSVGRPEKVTPPTSQVQPTVMTGTRFGDQEGGNKYVTTPDGKRVAEAFVDVRPDAVYVHDIKTNPGMRRQGHASALVDDLFKEFPGKKIIPYGITNDGAKFWQGRYNIDADGAITPKNSPSPQTLSGEGTTSGGAFRSPETNLPSKTRVLDEMQSDWAQRARDQGTRDPAQLETWKARKAELEAARSEVEKRVHAYVLDKTGNNYRMGPEAALDDLFQLGTAGDAGALKLSQEWTAFTEPLADVNTKLNAARDGVPSAPYISNTSDWVDLGLKQALIDAARDPRVSRMAWPPGRVHTKDRYPDLQEKIKAVRYNPDTQNLQFKIRDQSDNIGWSQVPERIAPDRIADYVGEDTAKSLLERPRVMEQGDLPSFHELHELAPDAEVMGKRAKGMIGFYGDMTPEGYQSGIVGTRLQKLVKGLDPEAARVEPHPLTGKGRVGFSDNFKIWVGTREDGTRSKGMQTKEEAQAFVDAYEPPKYPSVKITPEMRQKILKEGLPLFNIAALSALVNRVLGQGPADEEQ